MSNNLVTTIEDIHKKIQILDQKFDEIFKLINLQIEIHDALKNIVVINQQRINDIEKFLNDLSNS
jgi:hypothetical protein